MQDLITITLVWNTEKNVQFRGIERCSVTPEDLRYSITNMIETKQLMPLPTVH